MPFEREYAATVPRPATIYFDGLRYRGLTHCYADLRLIDEMNKTERRFVPLSDAEILPLLDDTPLRTQQFVIFGKACMDFMALDAVEPFHPTGVVPAEDRVAVSLTGYSLEGTLRRAPAFRTVDELNKSDSQFIDLSDVTVWSRHAEGVTVLGKVPYVLVAKARIGMILPLRG